MIIRKILASFGKERFYVRPLYESEMTNIFEKVGFKIRDKRFYNIHPLKYIHNHLVSLMNKNKIIMLWKELEEELGKDPTVIDKGRQYFLTMYFEVQRV